MLERFFGRISRESPNFLKRKLKGYPILIKSTSAGEPVGFSVDMWSGRVDRVGQSDFDRFEAWIEIPAIILRQAVLMNMFGHAGISKRVHYFAPSSSMPRLRRFVTILELAEAELIPLRSLFSRRAIRALLPRWREFFLYCRTVFELLCGLSLPQIERLLLASNRRRSGS